MEEIIEKNDNKDDHISISNAIIESPEMQVVKIQINEVERRIAKDIDNGILVVNNESTDLDVLMAMSEEDKFNLQIAKKKLEQAKQLKEEYENRLKAVQLDIQILEIQNNKSLVIPKSKANGNINSQDSEAKEKLKKIAAERNELEEKRRKRAEEFDNSFSLDYQKRKEIEKQKLLETLASRKEKALEEIERIKKQKEERDQIIEARNSEYKSLKQKKPQFMKIQENYKKKEKHNNEKINEIIHSMKDDYSKPIISDELKNFEKEYVRQRKEKIEEGKKAIEERRKYEVRKMPENYFTKIVSDEYEMFRHEREKTKEELNQYRMKIKEYQKQVHEHFQPVVDPRKIKEREELMQSFDKKPKSLSPDLPHIKGLDNLEFVKKLKKKRRNNGETASKVTNINQEIMERKNDTKSENHKNAASTGRLSFWSTRKKLGSGRFLEIEKIRRQLQDEGISKKDKAELMDRYKMLIDQAETKALYKEKLDKYTNGISLNEEEEEVDEIYIKSIQSKLAMLNQ